MNGDSFPDRTFPDAATMDRLVGVLADTLPVELRELLAMGGLDIHAMLRLQPLLELFILAREARGWNLKRAATIAGVKQKVFREFEDCVPNPAPWAVPYAVAVGMTTLMGEWIAANPVLAAELGWPAPARLAEVFGGLMHELGDKLGKPVRTVGGPRDMFVAPPGFTDRFDVERMRAAVEVASSALGSAELSPLVRELLENELGVDSRTGTTLPLPSEPAAPAIYQFKVTLNWIRPAIWRRIAVSSELTFAQLHEVLQIVMGWTNSHLHEFEFRGQIIGRSDPEWPRPVLREERTRLGDLGLTPKARLLYRYDFGDDWAHAVVLEKILPAQGAPLATCLAGKRAGPPEDCGSVPGYQTICALLANPKLHDPDGLRDWAGSFDPEAFDLEWINAGLKGLVKRWQGRAPRARGKSGRRP